MKHRRRFELIGIVLALFCTDMLPEESNAG
jgi:hypothetical protein